MRTIHYITLLLFLYSSCLTAVQITFSFYIRREASTRSQKTLITWSCSRSNMFSSFLQDFWLRILMMRTWEFIFPHASIFINIGAANLFLLFPPVKILIYPKNCQLKQTTLLPYDCIDVALIGWRLWSGDDKMTICLMLKLESRFEIT